MINETVILLIPLKDHSGHKLSKYIPAYMGVGHPFNLYDYEPLKKIFSKVIVYDYPKRMSEISMKAVSNEIIDLVRKEHPKYVVWITVHYEIPESTFNAISKEGTKVVGFFFDDESRFDEYSRWWIPFIDYFVTSDINAVPKYKKLGAKVIHSIPCHGIPVDIDWSNVKEKYDVSFVGTRSHEKEQYINEIKKRNIAIHLFGIGWEKFGGKWVSFKKMLEIFRTSKINLNFSKTLYGKRMWKGRIFQVLMAGGFLLTEYHKPLRKYFDIDKEVVCFHSAEEMIDKINYYLKHEVERRAIAQAGWKRAISEYTPFHMMTKVSFFA